MFDYQRVYVVYPHFVAIFLGHLRKIMTNFGGKMTTMQCHAGAGFFQTWVAVNLGRKKQITFWYSNITMDRNIPVTCG